jgi:cytochrome c oxidase subunit 1/cytochrome c oxidase subunit I+III
MAANLVVSRFRGAPAGPNPFGGATLEWATSSPPPPYNFAVIPTVRSEYPVWDAETLAEDGRRLELGVRTFPAGHEQPESTVRDGLPDALAEMPAESGWPIVVALCLTLVFAMLLTSHFVAAGVFAGLTALAGGAWLWQEPGE